MGLGYSAFGSQEWVRKLKPRRYFETRKTPAGENGAIVKHPDYQKLLLKTKTGNRHLPSSPVTYGRPSEALPFTIIMIIAMVTGAGIFFWYFF